MPLGFDVSKMHVLRTWMEGRAVRGAFGLDEWDPATRAVGTGVHPLPRATRPPTYLSQGGLSEVYDGGTPCIRSHPHQVVAGTVPTSHVQPEGGRHGSVSGRGSPPPRSWYGISRTSPPFPPYVRSWGRTYRRIACSGLCRRVSRAYCPWAPRMLNTFVLNYARQLNHPNPLTRSSARWGHMGALRRFGPDMPCVLRGFADCDRHPTDHDPFLRYTWLMEIRVLAVPESHAVEVTKHPWVRRGTPARPAMPMRPWRPATRIGTALAKRGGHHAFAGRNRSPSGPDTCGGPGRCRMRESPSTIYRLRRSLCRTPLGTPTTQPVAASWWRIR